MSALEHWEVIPPPNAARPEMGVARPEPDMLGALATANRRIGELRGILTLVHSALQGTRTPDTMVFVMRTLEEWKKLEVGGE